MSAIKAALTAFIVWLFVATPVAADAPTVEHITSPAFAELDLPFSQAVRVGHLLFLSGELGIDHATGKLVDGGIGPETDRILRNIQATLERAGSSMAEVVKCTVFLADIDEWAAMNKVYVTYFPGPKPARSALGTANGIALGARVELECIATVGLGR